MISFEIGVVRRVDKVVGDWSRHVVIDIVAIGIEGEILG